MRNTLSISMPAYLAAVCLLPWAAVAVAGGSHSEIELRQIADGVYVHLGEHHTVEHDGRDNIANLGVITGPECVAIIDTGGSVAMGRALLQAVEELSDKPVCYVINTHIHFDHLLGNPAFAANGASFVGHSRLPEELLRNSEFFKTDFAAELGQEVLPQVDIAVEGSHELSLGPGRTLKLVSWPAAHTHSDLTVLDEASGVLFAGDLVFRERTPVLDGKLLGWIDVLSKLRQLKVSHVVPGHGTVADGWDEALRAQSRYLEVLRDEVREAVASGVFMEDAIESVGNSEQSHWELFEFSHGRNVSKAFVELEWE